MKEEGFPSCDSQLVTIPSKSREEKESHPRGGLLVAGIKGVMHWRWWGRVGYRIRGKAGPMFTKSRL